MPSDRPRDRLGRPLPADADPATVAPPVPDASGLSDAQVWDLAASYLDAGMPFHAHEVFEDRWRREHGPDRDAWRALAQWGAALTHTARGNDEGARRLARRTLDTLAAAPSIPDGVDLARVTSSCTPLLAGGPP